MPICLQQIPYSKEEIVNFLKSCAWLPNPICQHELYFALDLTLSCLQDDFSYKGYDFKYSLSRKVSGDLEIKFFIYDEEHTFTFLKETCSNG